MLHYDSRDTTMVMSVINHVFEDKRLTAVLVMFWLLIVLVTFWSLGVMQTQFVSFGPSSETFFMGICLHTWPRWFMVATFTFVSTAVNDFVGDALVPFITNAIQDHKTIFLPYSKFTCWGITQALSIYGNIMSIFSIYLLLSQLDFMLIRLAADSIVNLYTTYRFMKDKRVNADKYYRSQRPPANCSEVAAQDPADDTTAANNNTDTDALTGSNRSRKAMDALRPSSRRKTSSIFKAHKRNNDSSRRNISTLVSRVHITDTHGAEYSGPMIDQAMQRASHTPATASIAADDAQMMMMMPATRQRMHHNNNNISEDKQQLLYFTPCAPSVDDINRQRAKQMQTTGLDMFVPVASVLENGYAAAAATGGREDEDTCVYTAQAAAAAPDEHVVIINNAHAATTETK